MEIVEHEGIVESMHEKTMQVHLEQSTACSGCHAQTICSSADKKDKLIDIPFFSGDYQIGQAVRIVGQPSIGLKAVALAYVIPTVLMITALAISFLWLFPGKDGLAALIALSVVALYYLSLYPFRKNIQNHFVFNVKPLDGNKSSCL